MSEFFDWEVCDAPSETPSRSCITSLGSWTPTCSRSLRTSFVVDCANPQRLYTGISAVGVFRSDDAGATWALKNAGVPVILENEEHEDIGYCVHSIVQDPQAPETLFRQDHMGIFRTRDAGESWERVGTDIISVYKLIQ